MLEEVFSEDACAMFSQSLFDSVEVKLSIVRLLCAAILSKLTYLVDSQRLGFKWK